MDEVDTFSMTPQAELISWHYLLDHLPFKLLRILANLRIIPHHLRHIYPLKCVSFIYSAMTKKPWRVKGATNRGRIHKITRSGECVSADQVESTTPGFVAQLNRKLNKDRYKCATVFLDHYSSLSYVHCQRVRNGEDTMEVKKAFEAYARFKGASIQHYHTDNGRFT